MRRSPLILSIVCALTTLSASGILAQQPNPPRATPANDKSPGWVIILGANAPDTTRAANDRTIQWDAIRAFRQFTGNLKVPADHIVLLARGADVENFERTKSLPAGFEGGAKNYEPTPYTEYTEKLLENQPRTSDLGLFKSRFYTKDATVPLHGEPTALNFKTARNAISKMAQSNQFVAVVVSAYVRAGSGQGDDKAKVKVLTGDDSELTDTDFQLAGCKAANRVLLLGGHLSHEDQDRVPNYSGLLGILNDSGSGITAQSVVIANNETGTGDKTARKSFLRYALIGLESNERPLAEYGVTLTNKVNGIGKDSQLFQDTMVAATSTSSTLAQLLPVPASPLTGMKSGVKITGEIGTMPGVSETIGVVKIGGKILVRMFGIPRTPYNPLERATLISKALKQQNLADLETIRIEARKKEFVLMTPKGQVVTVDTHTAQMFGMSPHDLAITMRQLIRRGFGLAERADPGAGMSAEDYFNEGNDKFNAGQYAEAEKNFREAIDGNPSYFFARVALVECCLKQGNKAEAMSALEEIKKGVQSNVFGLEDEGKKALARVSGEVTKL